MISQNISKLIAEAMKARDQMRLSTLRMLSSEFNYAKIEKQHDLTEEEELVVLKKEAKKRRESIEAYAKAGRQELVESEKAELKIIEEFLPAEMNDADLEKIVADVILETGASDVSATGRVIGMVMQKAGASADGSKVASMVRQKLSNG